MKTALITGSSRGIGKAIALELAAHGYQVVLNGLKNIQALQETEELICQSGGTCFSIPGDVGNYHTCQAITSAALSRFGGIDILVNNAGISHIGLLQQMTPAEWNRLIQTNLTSLYNMCSLLLPSMIARQKGSIINISSVWGITGASCEVAYSASKGAVNAFTKALAKETAPSGIRVNAVACGAIDTEMNHFLSSEELSALTEEIPTGRLGTPAEAAALVRTIAEGPSYLTGQVITLDGGWI